MNTAKNKSCSHARVIWGLETEDTVLCFLFLCALLTCAFLCDRKIWDEGYYRLNEERHRSLAIALINSGHLNDAEAALEKALSFSKKVNPRTHLSEVLLLNDLAKVQSKQGKVEAAISALRSAATLFERDKVIPNDGRDSFYVFTNCRTEILLGTLLAERGRYEECEKRLSAVLRRLEDNPKLLKSIQGRQMYYRLANLLVISQSMTGQEKTADETRAAIARLAIADEPAWRLPQRLKRWNSSKPFKANALACTNSIRQSERKTRLRVSAKIGQRER